MAVTHPIGQGLGSCSPLMLANAAPFDWKSSVRFAQNERFLVVLGAIWVLIARKNHPICVVF
jgi:hypothetical protein